MGQDATGTEAWDGNNPLLRLWRARWRETVRHFWVTGWAQAQLKGGALQGPPPVEPVEARAGAPEQTKLHDKHETLAVHPLLSTWRDSCRDFAASLYAYATPTPAALGAIEAVLRGEGESPVLVARLLLLVWSMILES